MSLSALPNELILIIASSLSPQSLNRLLQTNRFFADLLTPNIHKRAAEPKDGIPALCWAVEQEHIPLIHLLVNSGIDVNLPDITRAWQHMGGTALHQAMDGEVARLLLENGAKVDAVDIFNFTSLHYAVGRGDVATMKVLFEYGAKADGMDPRGNTPLFRAVGYCVDEEVFRLLVDNGADINAEKLPRVTPLHVAVIELNDVAIRFLLRRGARVCDRRTYFRSDFFHKFVLEYCPDLL